MGAPKGKKPVIIGILFIILAGILVCYFLYISPWIKRMRYPLKYEKEIKEYSAEYSIDPYLVSSIIWTESRFVPDAVSGRDARGLMQLLPTTAAWAAEKMDLEDFEEKARAGARFFILCNPHNPVGRCWTAEELRAVGEICLRYGITVISDEIHSDLMLYGHKHTVMASLSPEIAGITITAIAPSKTFNLAGLPGFAPCGLLTWRTRV